jgi:hypothetical protein
MGRRRSNLLQMAGGQSMSLNVVVLSTKLDKNKSKLYSLVDCQWGLNQDLLVKRQKPPPTSTLAVLYVNTKA